MSRASLLARRALAKHLLEEVSAALVAGGAFVR
jgi:hypothetical protein